MTKVKLRAMTKPMVYDDGDIAANMSIGDFVAYVARVSNPANQNNTLTANKLLKYLAKHHHWSPFEMVSLTMEINTTRDIGRQILRHRSFSFQEFSQRYADPTKMEFVKREARLQDTKNRQNSIETEEPFLHQTWESLQRVVAENALNAYKWAIDNGVAKEQARVVLPEGLTPTKMYMAGTLRSWIHYCQLRMEKGTQKEHREIAEQCWKIIISRIPALEEILVEEPACLREDFDALLQLKEQLASALLRPARQED
jgi:thymidylate synthase (FAD)